MLGDFIASKVQSQNGVRESISLIVGHSVQDTIPSVEYDAGRATRRVERQNSLRCTRG